MLSAWSQGRGQHSCRWSLFLLSGLLKLFGIAEALTVTEVTSDVSSPPVIETKVISRTGENVTLYCRADFPISDLSVSWYHLGEDGSHAKVRSYSPHDDHIQEHPEFRGRTLLIISPGEVLLTLWIVRPEDSGTYICVQENNHQSTERYMILQVTEKDEDLVVIYSMVGFLSVGLVAWIISFSILWKRGDLHCPRNLGQEV